MKRYEAKENVFLIIDCLPYTQFVCTNGMYIKINDNVACSIPLGKGDLLIANKEFSIRRTINETTLELYNFVINRRKDIGMKTEKEIREKIHVYTQILARSSVFTSEYALASGAKTALMWVLGYYDDVSDTKSEVDNET